jgi:D-sedoheptulose 7-phosphate isomerase
LTWKDNVTALSNALLSLSTMDREGISVPGDQGFSLWVGMTRIVREQQGTVFLIGNGASASMACHFAADMVKNAHIRTEVFTDPALLTALANDLSYDRVFSEPLSWKMTSRDMLVAISSSGNSPNILRGAEKARELGGAVVTLSAMHHDNRLRGLGDLNFYIPGETYGMAESAHASILHYWMDLVAQEAPVA